MYKEKESGRSMVEMLGVLAIIGVLSVGGIAGYTTAMNKHRANQILNEASVRAIVVSTQIQRGADTPTLAEFPDRVGKIAFESLVFSTDGSDLWNKEIDKRFTLFLYGIDEKVCQQMKASVGQNSIIKAIGENCETLTYNNDLSPNDPALSGPPGDECTTECPNGATCVKGYCQCSSGSIWNPTDNSGNGECKEITEGDCTTNADCKEAGKYCQIEGRYEYENENDCFIPTTGTCETLDDGAEITYNDKTFLHSSSEMNWWSARNWCLAHEKSLASLSDLSCTTKSCDNWFGLSKTLGGSLHWTSGHGHCSAFAVANDPQLSYGYTKNLPVLCR